VEREGGGVRFAGFASAGQEVEGEELHCFFELLRSVG
jgi:hypothetical protein